MGTSSPESSKSITNSNSSLLLNPIQVQESSVFSFSSYLSPIKPDNVVPVVQGFPGINSPPFIFRSPQIDQIRKKNSLRMTQFTRLSDGGLSRQDENVEDIDTVSERSGISSNQPKSSSISSPQKPFAIKNSPNTKVSSRPGSTNDYFPVMVNMDGGAFASSVSLSPKNSDEGFQSQNDLLHSKGSVEKTEDKDDTTKDKLTIGAPPANIDQAEEDDHTLDNQHGGQLKSENAGSGHLFEMAFTSQLGCMQIVQDSGSCENAVPFTASIENEMDGQNPKVGQYQHGICRRLQFQDGPGKTMADSGSQIASETTGYLRSPASPADPEVLESASLLQPVTQSNVLASMARAVFSPQDGGNYNIKVPKQSFGLHLNSIVARKVDFDMTVSVKSAVGGSFDGLEKGSISIMNRHLRKNSAISSNAVEGASLSSNDNMCDNHTPTGASYARSSYSIKPLCEPELLKSIQLESNHSNKRMCNSENFGCFGDFGKLSPKKKRKKTMDDGDSNDCKRCNCKKTKCLKLYCDCFAAGNYCDETCACQDCFNRPEFEDTVLDIRKQIELRNPLAFAPKIIQHISEPPTKVFAEDGDLTHSSGRHKRGCNCKKSKCSKKYCECYQANVGCSDGCRCEKCDNVYGRKEEYGTIKDLVSKQGNRQKLDSSYDVMLKGVAAKNSLLHNALYSPQNLTPLTPTFQYSDHGKGASRAFCHSESYLQSPESDLNLISSFGLSSRSAKSPDTSDMVLQTHTEIMDLVSFDQEINYVNGHTAIQLSPRYDGPSNVGQHTAATLHNPHGWANSLRAQTFTGNRNVSSSGALRWRGSPCNPPAHFGASTLHKVADNENGLYSRIDDTPEILKEPSIPRNAVKISSPNKKRVSPPHGQQTELGYDSSVGLRSGRKFILKSVPSFPLTPCMNSQNAFLNMDTSQSSSSSK